MALFRFHLPPCHTDLLRRLRIGVGYGTARRGLSACCCVSIEERTSDGVRRPGDTHLTAVDGVWRHLPRNSVRSEMERAFIIHGSKSCRVTHSSRGATHRLQSCNVKHVRIRVSDSVIANNLCGFACIKADQLLRALVGKVSQLFSRCSAIDGRIIYFCSKKSY